MAGLVDSVLGMFTKTPKDPDAPKPPVGSRSEREAKIKDKAGLVINIFALLLAVNSWYGGKLGSTVLNNTIAANNQWAWYQAKNIREVLYTTSAMDSRIPENKAKFEAEAKRMEEDKKQIMEKAKALEAEREIAKQKSPWFTWGGSVLQIAIVLLTASILAVSMPMFYISVVVGSLGSLFVSQALWMWLPI